MSSAPFVSFRNRQIEVVHDLLSARRAHSQCDHRAGRVVAANVCTKLKYYSLLVGLRGEGLNSQMGNGNRRESGQLLRHLFIERKQQQHFFVGSWRESNHVFSVPLAAGRMQQGVRCVPRRVLFVLPCSVDFRYGFSMHSTRVCFLLLLAVFTWSVPSYARDEEAPAFLDGLQLLNLCEGTALSLSVCNGYIMGADDAYRIAAGLPQSNLAKWCSPPHGSITQLRLVVVKYLKNHPEKLDLVASFEVAVALREAFPCATD